MKFLIVGLLTLCSCVINTTSDLTEDSAKIYILPFKNPWLEEIPAPILSPEENHSKCITDAYWIGNCYIVKTFCKGSSDQIEISCGADHLLFPWEVVPDPPFSNRK